MNRTRELGKDPVNELDQALMIKKAKQSLEKIKNKNKNNIAQMSDWNPNKFSAKLNGMDQASMTQTQRLLRTQTLPTGFRNIESARTRSL